MSLIGSGFLTIFSFVFLISIVVVIHELGHYWAGRFCGVHAETFSMGFGPTLVSWRDKRGTVWRVAALPLGGYVKFLGDAGAASEPDADKLALLREQMGEAADRCYHFKPIWQRAFITAAGPIANFILAIFIFASHALIFGDEQVQPVIGFVQPGSPSEAAGFEIGDRIVRVGNREISGFMDISQALFDRANDTVSIDVERDGALITLVATPQRVAQEDRFGGTRNVGQIGIGPFYEPVIGMVVEESRGAAAGFRAGDRVVSVDGQTVETFGQFNTLIGERDGELTILVERDGSQLEIIADPVPLADIDRRNHAALERLGLGNELVLRQHQSFTLLTAPVEGARMVWTTVTSTASYVGRIVSGRSSPEYLNGPIGIATAAGQVAHVAVDDADSVVEGAGNLLRRLIFVAGFLSVGLGLVNLLPIPILDGGHLVYYAYEAVARRPLSMKAQALGFRVGLVFVLGLMLVATWNDLNYLLGQIF
ncbi:hypothetical protein AWH62_04380 [Maricaulis sp. W15]|uniref:RIP metalloprotease RseP n=1 Tax=Maricaulis sp. W15 TaxID=1772333 RepID=UPI0009490389|nr:RIP metalloprotease RseP [Maricaulis sp. W15]OLF77914.1 hypothetical protein AWH62_04380 [Maricaulis sp. W15]